MSSPLNVAVVGVGRIGSTFAFRLARAGHDVTAVARPGSSRLDQLRSQSHPELSGQQARAIDQATTGAPASPGIDINKQG